MFKNTNELYFAIYNYLIRIRDNKRDFFKYINQENQLKRNQISNVIVQYNLIEGIIFDKVMSGNTVATAQASISLTSNGLRFIKYFESYNDKDIDIFALLTDNSGIIEYYIQKDKHSMRNQIIITLLTILVTAFVSVLINNAFSREFYSQSILSQSASSIQQLYYRSPY